MVGTLSSLVLTVLIYLFSEKFSGSFDAGTSNIAVLFAGTAVLVGIIMILTSTFNPLIKAEKKLTPRLMTMFKEDKIIFFAIAYISLFIMISYFFGVFEFKGTPMLFALWLVLFGVACDAIFALIKRVYSYVNPFEIVEMFASKGRQDIRNEKEIDLTNCIEGLTEIAVKSVHHQSSSLSTHIVEELGQLTKNFLGSAKSLSHHDVDQDTEKLGIKDKVSYTLFYLFQRLELIFNKALESNNDPLCINVLQVMGKISLHAAKYDITIASYPLHYIGKFIKQLIKKEKGHVLEMTSCVLQETAQLMMEEMDLSYLEIKETYVNIINYMDLIAKELFREDKTISFAVLEQPFQSLKQLFSQDKIKFHPDTPAITQNIDRVISEFETLKTILQTMPKI